jgi:nucleoside-diphosphate-sugar epimerase
VSDTVQGNISKHAEIAPALVGMHAVVHLAGNPSTQASWESVRDNNIEGTYNVFEAARQAGVQKIVFATTNHVMGMYDRDRQWPIYVTQPPRPDSLYGVSKAFGETLGRHYVDRYGLSIICLRIGWFLDRPHDEIGLWMWLSPRDCAQAVWRAIESPLSYGVFYTISRNSRRHWDLTETIEKLGYLPEDDADRVLAARPPLHPEDHGRVGDGRETGEEEAAVARAAATVAAFSTLGPLDHVVVNAAGCGAAMKEYGELLGTPEARGFSARVRDITELLAEVEPRAPRGPVPLRVVYHDACHLAHAQGVRAQPRSLLRGIPGLELLEVAVQPEVCCGSAGIYNLVQPQAAAELGAMKARNLIDTGAEAIAAGNPGCAAQLDLHLRELGHPLPIHHPVELVWRSIEAGR